MTSDRKLTIVTDSHYFDHDTGGGEHPENPVRLEVIMDSLVQSPVLPMLDFVKPRPATRQQLLAGHDEGWLFRFEELVLSGRTYIDHTDNQVCYDSFNVATLSAGAGITGIDLLECGSAEDRQEIMAVLEDGSFERASYERLHESLVRHGCLDRTMELAERYADQARETIARFPQGPHRDALEDLTEMVLRRDR